jgi:ATP-dependent DNA ligase
MPHHERELFTIAVEILVRPELVAEVTFLTWTDDGLLRQVVYQGLRDHWPAYR